MTESQGHTELPWAATTRKGNLDWVIYSENDPNIEIGQLFHDGTEFNETGEANANLIVTAVNTYPVVEGLVKALEGADEWLSGWASAEPYLTQIRAALSRFRSLQNGGANG